MNKDRVERNPTLPFIFGESVLRFLVTLIEKRIREQMLISPSLTADTLTVLRSFYGTGLRMNIQRF